MVSKCDETISEMVAGADKSKAKVSLFKVSAGEFIRL